MTLTKKAFQKKFNELLIAFPNWNVDFEDSESMSFWYKTFSYLNDSQYERMVDRFIENEKFNPTVASLKEYAPKKHEIRRELTPEEQLKEVKEDLSLGKEYFEMSNKIGQYDALLKERERLEQL